MGNTMKNRSDKTRSYNGPLMGIGAPGEEYIARYLESEYSRVDRIGVQKQRRDYRCFLPDGTIHHNEGKTDTMIAKTGRIPWEIFRLENNGQRAYIAWGYNSDCYRVIYYVPQWFRLLDVHADEVRGIIFDHIMNNGVDIHIYPTVTDNDRITFNICVPLTLLKAHGCVKEVEIAESPVGPDIPYQGQLATGGIKL